MLRFRDPPGDNVLMDELLSSETLMARALVGKSEAQLRHDILPEGDERQTMREKIHLYDLLLNLNDNTPA